MRLLNTVDNFLNSGSPGHGDVVVCVCILTCCLLFLSVTSIPSHVKKPPELVFHMGREDQGPWLVTACMRREVKQEGMTSEG